MIKVTISEISQADIEDFNNSGLDGTGILLSGGRKKMEVTDQEGNNGVLFIDEETIERLGIEYIKNNTCLEKSVVLGNYSVKLSQNAYYNNLERFPEKTVDVVFHDDKSGERTEVYKNPETGKLYLRMLCNDRFARWMSCDNHYIDQGEIRANIIFQHGSQKEKVTYDDWNGNAAYSGTFNPDFKEG